MSECTINIVTIVQCFPTSRKFALRAQLQGLGSSLVTIWERGGKPLLIVDIAQDTSKGAEHRVALTSKDPRPAGLSVVYPNSTAGTGG